MVHHALTDKLSKGDNPHCTPNLGQKIPEPILRTCNQVCRTPSTRHALNTLYHTPHSAPCHPQTAAASELTFKPSLAPIYLLKHLLTTSLVPRQQAGVNQLPVERIDKKHYGWMAEVPQHDPSIFKGPGMIWPTQSCILPQAWITIIEKRTSV
ncbi:Asparagine synthetase domain containing protein 1 [Dissostichus eleginoides]|uniref:Asparagine synthetase domain containing protein 1 n=1 Tax=Dissostichus eleginoides TaxID=100907 RepID=A0AAD9C5E0_DISEL|nr:Asparagine synthetase domain containing protein 1 [Dissostichus eleginoides]